MGKLGRGREGGTQHVHTPSLALGTGAHCARFHGRFFPGLTRLAVPNALPNNTRGSPRSHLERREGERSTSGPTPPPIRILSLESRISRRGVVPSRQATTRARSRARTSSPASCRCVMSLSPTPGTPWLAGLAGLSGARTVIWRIVPRPKAISCGCGLPGYLRLPRTEYRTHLVEVVEAIAWPVLGSILLLRRWTRPRSSQRAACRGLGSFQRGKHSRGS